MKVLKQQLTPNVLGDRYPYIASRDTGYINRFASTGQSTNTQGTFTGNITRVVNQHVVDNYQNDPKYDIVYEVSVNTAFEGIFNGGSEEAPGYVNSGVHLMMLNSESMHFRGSEQFKRVFSYNSKDDTYICYNEGTDLPSETIQWLQENASTIKSTSIEVHLGMVHDYSTADTWHMTMRLVGGSLWVYNGSVSTLALAGKQKFLTFFGSLEDGEQPCATLQTASNLDDLGSIHIDEANSAFNIAYNNVFRASNAVYVKA